MFLVTRLDLLQRLRDRLVYSSLWYRSLDRRPGQEELMDSVVQETVSPIVYALLGAKVVILIAMGYGIWRWRRRERHKDQTDPFRRNLRLQQSLLQGHQQVQSWSHSHTAGTLAGNIIMTIMQPDQAEANGAVRSAQTVHLGTYTAGNSPLATWLTQAINGVLTTTPCWTPLPTGTLQPSQARFSAAATTVLIHDPEPAHPPLALAMCDTPAAAQRVAAQLNTLLHLTSVVEPAPPKRHAQRSHAIADHAADT